jgi:4-amino-4-deoxy-L-arabinose transferase-like glycosyltransferase
MTAARATAEPGAPTRHARPRRSLVGLRRDWPVLVLAALAVAATLLVRHSFFPYGFSGDADEGTYVLQAHLLLDGHLTLPAGSFTGAFRPWLTGESDGHVFTQYLPGWPAMLAGSSVLLGSMMWAPVLAAAGWVIAVYALTMELLADRRTATIAAGLLGCSPILLVHGVVYLPYAFSAATLTAAVTCLLRGMRLGTKVSLVSAGMLSGVALLTRPFDLLLVAAPTLLFLTAGHRTRLVDAGRALGWVAAGSAPFVLLLLLFDLAVTGHPFLTPLSAADPLNRFGFGVRRLMPGEPTVEYSVSTAVLSLRANVHGMASWLFGGPAVAGLAAVGLSFRSRRRERLLLGALAVAFPVGYFFWWGTALSAHGAVNGIGPHYYLPAFGPLVILAADASVRAYRTVRVRLMGTTAILVIALTLAAGCAGCWTAVQSKIRSQNAVNAEYRQAVSLLPPAATDTLVVVSANPPSSFVGRPYPFWNNSALTATRLFAADPGPAGYQLGLEFPHRQLIRLSLAQALPSNGLTVRAGRPTLLTTVTGPVLWVHATFISPATGAVLTGYLSVDHHQQRKTLTSRSISGKVFHCDWPLTAADLRPGPQYVTVGLAEASTHSRIVDWRWEQRFSAGPSPQGAAAQTPGYPWRLAPTPPSPVWQPMNVNAVMRIQVDQMPTGTIAP